MKRLGYLFFLSLVLVVLLAGCGGGGGKSVFDDPTVVNSPNGSVPLGDRAYSPSGLYYATVELAPQNMGVNIHAKDGQFLVPLRETSTDTKGIAWSRDGKCVVVMTHSHQGNLLTYFDAQTGELTRQVSPRDQSSAGYFHFIVFSGDNSAIYLSYRGNNIDLRFSSGLPSTIEKHRN